MPRAPLPAAAGRRAVPLADALFEAHRSGIPVPSGLQTLTPASIREAHAVQDQVLGAIAPGQRPTAWKVSPPTQPEWQASPVPPAGVHASPARLPVPPGLLGVECEIAFRLTATPSPTMSREELLGCAEAVVLIELCATRYADFGRASALERLSDFQSHAAFVVGSGVRDWGTIRFAAVEMTLEIGGVPVMARRGSHATCDLAPMLAWAVGHAAGRGFPLRSGDVVTTGTWNGITPIEPGKEAVARFAGIGEARLLLG